MSQTTKEANRTVNENILHSPVTKGPPLPPAEPVTAVTGISLASGAGEPARPVAVHTTSSASALIPSVATLERLLDANAKERKKLQSLLKLAKEEEGCSA